MKNLLVVLMLLGSLNVLGQEPTLEMEEVDQSRGLFFDQCLGVWEGKMYIHGGGKLRDSVDIRFTCAPTDTLGRYVWRMDYLSEQRPMVKDYRLVVKDAERGLYIMDEGNGVELMEFVVGNKMYSNFKMGPTILTSSMERLGESLVFEVTSGTERADGQDLISFTVDYVQRVILMPIKE